MGNKKVLIITYYWPPGGGAGVQRWLKFVKYLPQFGYDPVIYTPSNGEMPVLDESLEKDVPASAEVIRRPIWEPYTLYKKFIGAGKHEKINTGFLAEKKRPGLAERISVWLRGNLFIPDARCFWIKPSVKFLEGWLKENHVDAIVSTGPPHSMHLIALPLAGKFNIPWIADFRDPWTNIDFYKDLMLTASADRKHHRLEQAVVTSADFVVVVSNGMKQEFEGKYNRHVEVITNGFDEDDVKSSSPSSPARFTITHVGTLVRTRNPQVLWQVVSEMAAANADFASSLEIRLTGKVDVAVRESLKQYGLEKFTRFTEYLPHDQVAREQQSAAILLLILNNTPNAKSILTGKLYEYLAAKRPVLCIGPADGDAAEIIHQTGSGQTVDFTDREKMKSALVMYFEKFKSGTLIAENKNVEQFSRRNLTKNMAGLLDKLTTKSVTQSVGDKV